MDAFEVWRKDVTAGVASLPLSGGVYRESGNLGHYRRVSSALLERFDDSVLARAAFLHGVHPSEFREVRHRIGFSLEVQAILEERNKLRSIGGRGGDAGVGESEGDEVARLLVANVLPLIRDARSVILFVCEQIDHLDTDEAFTAWTLDFDNEPRPLPSHVLRPRARVHDRFVDVAVRARFLRYVVAATAEAFGMWNERNVARNMALAHERRERFDDILAWVTRDHGAPDGASHERERYVLMRLDRGVRPLSVKWEWRHVASLDEQLVDDVPSDVPAAITPHLWSKRFDHLGHVTIVCRTADQCYRALSRLHASGEYLERGIRDFIAAPRLSGYAALHTTLTRRGNRAEFPDLIKVHIMTEKVWQARSAMTGAPNLARMQMRITRADHASLRVFADDGRVLDLPLGSTVLNFALHVHSHFLPRLRGATVNRVPVGVLHPLRNGDVVFLTLSDIQQLLPIGWEEHVPASTVYRLRTQFVRAYRATLEKNGRRWLRQYLSRYGRDEVSDSELDEHLATVAKDLFNVTEKPEWIYRQLGMHEAREQGSDLGPTSFDSTRVGNLAAGVTVRIREAPSDEAEFEIPTQFAGKFDQIQSCPQCTPLPDEPRAATLRDRVLTIHRLKANCATDALILRRQSRPVDDQHYFVVETTNRIGIGSELLAIFQSHDVDLSELVGRRLAPGWSVFRIGADFLGAERRAEIKRDVLSVSGVMRVIGPDEPSIQFFDTLMPPPTAPVHYWVKPAPYQAGPPLEDDRFFYGFWPELTELERVFDSVAANTSSGEFLFVRGPLRVGKTSVVKQFLRLIARDPSRPNTAVYHFPKQTRWTEIADTMRQKLVANVPNPPEEVKRTHSLQEAIAAVRQHTVEPVVLVIDEIVGLLATNSRWPEELAAFRAFHDEVRATPGVLVVWIGPQLALHRVDLEIRQLLSNSRYMDVGALHEDDVDAMLRARKMGSTYQIELFGRLARAVTQLTSGNPYWVSVLAQHMFKLARSREASRRMTYTFDKLKKAKERFFLDGHAFADRVESPFDARDPHARTVKRAILDQLADPGVRMTSDDLSVVLQQYVRREVLDYLEELRLTGSVKVDDNKWRIAAPILGEYITRLNKEKGSVS
ncbi:MAG: TGS domain-containing protein [Acidobacteriota bacterium]